MMSPIFFVIESDLIIFLIGVNDGDFKKIDFKFAGHNKRGLE